MGLSEHSSLRKGLPPRFLAAVAGQARQLGLQSMYGHGFAENYMARRLGTVMALDWQPYILKEHDHTNFPSDSRVLDVGCGSGLQLSGLREKGCHAIGIDPFASALKPTRDRGLDVLVGRAEILPFGSSCFDGILCKAALSYTDEAKALEEIARVMRSNAELDLLTHGAGFYSRYLLQGSAKERFYGLRAILSTWLYTLSGFRLPGFLGDTTYQTRRRLQKNFSRIGMERMKDSTSPTFLGLPVFIYQRLQLIGNRTL